MDRLQAQVVFSTIMFYVVSLGMDRIQAQVVLSTIMFYVVSLGMDRLQAQVVLSTIVFYVVSFGMDRLQAQVVSSTIMFYVVSLGMDRLQAQVVSSTIMFYVVSLGMDRLQAQVVLSTIMFYVVSLGMDRLQAQVDLKHKHQSEDTDHSDIPVGIDLSDFYLSVEWDVMGVPARRKEKFYSCCDEPYPDITFNVTLRRKTLFYTVNLIIPCVAISFLSVVVFYLPSESGEKVSLSISIVLSLGVFFLLLSEIIPPTSLTVPLLGKYLLFTMILVSFSVFVTIAVLNVNFRSPSTHHMAPWVRTVFLEILPKVLRMKRPQENEEETQLNSSFGTADARHPDPARKPGFPEYECSFHETGYMVAGIDDDIQGGVVSGVTKMCPELEKAVLNIRFVAQHMENQDGYSEIEGDWQFVAMILDRLFLWIFTLACAIGSACIILEAPSLYDDQQPIDVLLSKMAPSRLHHLKN
ncbi:acetylcholine receptor subunit alpha-like 1 [Limulus polyphemus]|uniref:Acetylcholine receptor subunit alpha-like 1 n=1 Tax=Limulus polyphemus TaxID=6850 RepID=A0ABM1BYE6_LIMPO|nr:acetylcholine receptor subunit alpha-like 1 [Limulus polyphemus]